MRNVVVALFTAPAALELVATREFQGSSNVLHVYRPQPVGLSR